MKVLTKYRESVLENIIKGIDDKQRKGKTRQLHQLMKKLKIYHAQGFDVKKYIKKAVEESVRIYCNSSVYKKDNIYKQGNAYNKKRQKTVYS